MVLALCASSLLATTVKVEGGHDNDMYHSRRSESRSDFELLQKHWNEGGMAGSWKSTVPHTIIVETRDTNGDVLSATNVESLQRLNDKIATGSNPSYQDICAAENGKCKLNYHTILTSLAFIRKQGFLTFPVTEMQNFSPYVLSGVLGGVSRDLSGKVLSARSIQLHYPLAGNVSSDDKNAFAILLTETCHNLTAGGSLTAYDLSDSSFAVDFERNSKELAPRLLILVVVMFAAAGIVSLRLVVDGGILRVPLRQSGILAALVGLLSSFLACFAAFGLLFWMNTPFLPMLNLIPFCAVGEFPAILVF